MALICSNAFASLVASCKNGNGILNFGGFIMSVDSQSFATPAAAGDRDNWVNDIINGLLFTAPAAKQVADQSADDVIWTSESQEKIKLQPGKVEIVFSLYLTAEQHATIYTWSGSKGNIYIYDLNGKILCTNPSGTIRRGFKVSYLDVASWKAPGADQPMLTNITVQLEDVQELNKNLAVIDPQQGVTADRWLPSGLPSLSEVTVEQVGSVAANVLTFDVKQESSRETGNDGLPVIISAVSGLDVTTPFDNFVFTDGASVVTPNTITESSTVPGRYEATFTTFTTGTVQVVPTVDNVWTSDALAVT